MPRGKSNLATVPTLVDFGQPSTRLQKLLDATRKREPYALTDTIVVSPPTRNNRQRLDALSYSLARTQTLMQDALRLATEDPPAAPEDPSDDERAEHEALMKAWEVRINSASEEFRDHSAALERDNDEWTRTLLGDSYDTVNAFLGEQEPELWEAVIADIRDHFQSPIDGPDDGICKTCGTVVDEEQAGKDTESST